jgi:polysaccharide deacetylase family protein (PEP-CTERM system associated)
VYTLNHDEFREDTRRARSVIEQALGHPVLGYRAPSFSITQKSSWALEVLCEEGFLYDSSVFPVLHDIYGWPGAPRDPHVIETPAGHMWEFPPATFQVFGRWTLPVAGGGYLRILPMAFTRFGLQQAASRNCPLLIYCHPWELDPGQPRFPSSLRFRLRHYTGLRTMKKKLLKLLACYSFTSIEKYLSELELDSGSNTTGGVY